MLSGIERVVTHVAHTLTHTRTQHTHTCARILSLALIPRVSLSFPSSTFHRTLLLSRLNSRPCINYLVTPRVPRLFLVNLCDLFGLCSHSSCCHAAIIYLYRSEFFESLFEFPGNDRIKRPVNTDSGEINYLFQLDYWIKKNILKFCFKIWLKISVLNKCYICFLLFVIIRFLLIVKVIIVLIIWSVIEDNVCISLKFFLFFKVNL